MAVRIRLKKMGRTHRPYFRLCAVDARAPRDGRVIEELGHYDPMLPETDARARLKADRIDYWLGVGAQPSDKAAVLIKKYGTDGTHLAAQEAALARLSSRKQYTPQPSPARSAPAPGKAAPAEGATATGQETPVANGEAPAEG